MLCKLTCNYLVCIYIIYTIFFSYHFENYLKHDIKATNWTLEEGYPKDLGRDTYPKRALSAGQGAGLEILLRAYEKDLDYICRGPVQGFKV